jgi:cytochrome P450
MNATVTDSRANARACELLLAQMTTEQGKQNPYQYFPELHELGETVKTPDGAHFAISYAAASELLRSRQFIKGNQQLYLPPESPTTPEQLRELMEISNDATPMLSQLDPPDHTRIRSLVQRSFTPRHIGAFEKIIPAEVDRLLDQLNPKKPLDIIASFSAILAPNIMASLIGLPVEHRAAVSVLTSIFMQGTDPGSNFEVLKASAVAGRKQREFVRAVIADRRATPQDDLVSALAAIDTSELSDEELVTLLQILYIGGYETTAHMIGNGLVALLTNPAQFALLREDPGLVESAVEEILRYDGAIAMVKTQATDGASYRGAPAEPGAAYIAFLAAANRDPEAFPNPEVFDITRKGRQHLTFSAGAHFCLGANLAKSELEKAFLALVQRYPNMQLAEGVPRRTNNYHLRSYQKVTLLLEP